MWSFDTNRKDVADRVASSDRRRNRQHVVAQENTIHAALFNLSAYSRPLIQQALRR